MKVSVIMANYRGAEHLFAAIASVLRQSHADLELIVSDDASPDRSVALVRDAMARDSRVRLIESPVNIGPSGARNRALDIATGDWIAIVDSDDLLHPYRFERLLSAAARLGADIVADDLVFFGDTLEAGGRTLLQPLDICAPMSVTADFFLEASGENRRIPALGYLKPIIRRRLIGTHRYDESLRTGEDYDFILRLLLSGGRFAVVADPMYLYRRHTASISHRLTESAVSAMLAAHDRVASAAGAAERLSLARRRRGLLALWRYERLLDAIRRGRGAHATGLLLRHPGLAMHLIRSLGERFSRYATLVSEKLPADIRLGTGLPHREAGMLSLPCPVVPEAGLAWSEPPARMASVLSRLSARYRLSCMAEDEAGAWAAGLVPPGGEAQCEVRRASEAAVTAPTGP
jgi:succinoglycan biosynthesis protein ExoO